ncbi:MAG TPA: hypothetical protein VMV29_22825 [Ktedonobacterales bacterium]|nr:hypothetical protein [Ktedonobacterales bacterium]
MATTNRKASGQGLSAIIEQRLETPVFFIVGAMMVISAAQMYSGGALVMSTLLGPWFPAFQIVRGVGLGLGSEMLMSIAGRSWRYWSHALTEIASQTGIPKATKTANLIEARANAKQSRVFMFVGMASSVYAGVSYLLINNHITSLASLLDNLGALFGDTMICVVITSVVFYLGVLKSHRQDGRTERLLDALDDGMGDALHAAITRFKDSHHTDQDVAFIAEHLAPGQAAKFRRATAKRDATRYWKASEIREALGMRDSPTAIRRLNDTINKLAKRPECGLQKAEDGRTWLVPHVLVMDVWGEPIADYRALLKSQTAQASAQVRGMVGASAPIDAGLPTPAPTRRRPPADVHMVPSGADASAPQTLELVPA